MSLYLQWTPDGARSLYKLVDKIHKQYGTTIIAVEHRVDYVLPYVTDMIVLNEGELVAADAFEAAAPKMYENPALRPLLPSLWQIKLGLEEKTRRGLGDWRSEEDALADFRTYGIVAAEGELTDVRSKGCQFRLYAWTACNQGYGLQDRGRRICGVVGT